MKTEQKIKLIIIVKVKDWQQQKCQSIGALLKNKLQSIHTTDARGHKKEQESILSNKMG